MDLAFGMPPRAPEGLGPAPETYKAFHNLAGDASTDRLSWEPVGEPEMAVHRWARASLAAKLN